jgi:hypothetical protein
MRAYAKELMEIKLVGLNGAQKLSPFRVVAGDYVSIRIFAVTNKDVFLRMPNFYTRGP